MSRPAWLVADGNLAFTDSTAANAWATANPSLVYDGLLATIGGSAYIWTSGAWVAAAGSGADLSSIEMTNGIMGLGDSITANYNSIIPWIVIGSGGRFVHVSYGTTNGGVSGNTLTQMAARMYSIIQYKIAGHIFIQGGTNDVMQGIAWATSKTALDNILLSCRGSGIKLIVGGIPIIGVVSTVDYSAASIAFNASLEAWANDNDLAFVRSWDTTCQAAGAPVIGNTGISADQIHPSPGAYPIAGMYAASQLIENHSAKLPTALDLDAIADGRNLVPNQNATTRIASSTLADGWGIVGGTASIDPINAIKNKQKNTGNATVSSINPPKSIGITPGKYLVGANVSWETTVGGSCALWFDSVGSTQGGLYNPVSTALLYAPVAGTYLTIVDYSASQTYIQMGMGVNTGGSSTVLKATRAIMFKIR